MGRSIWLWDDCIFRYIHILRLASAALFTKPAWLVYNRFHENRNRSADV